MKKSKYSIFLFTYCWFTLSSCSEKKRLFELKCKDIEGEIKKKEIEVEGRIKEMEVKASESRALTTTSNAMSFSANDFISLVNALTNQGGGGFSFPRSGGTMSPAPFKPNADS